MMLTITIILAYIALLLTGILFHITSGIQRTNVKCHRSSVVHLTPDHEEKLKSKIGIEE